MIKLLLILLLSSPYVLGTPSPTFGLMNIYGEPLELIDLKLKATVNLEAPYKEVQYLSTFKNIESHPIEAVFHFLRQGDFIFHKFEAIFHDNKTLVGKIVNREDNHTEPDSSEVVNITVGHLQANETVQILFSVIQSLKAVLNKFFELKFPAITNQEPPFTFNSNLQEWDIQVEITSKKPLSILSNPTHRFKPDESNSPTYHKATWNVTILTNKDFIIYFAPERLSDIEILSITHPEDPNDHIFLFTALPDMGVFSDSFAQNALQNTSDDGLLTLQKAAFTHDQQRFSPQYVFMIDRSDSMKGPRFETLKKALIDLLQVLPESNEVEILSFGNTFELFKIKDKYPYADESPTVKEAIEYVKTLEANMGEKNLLTVMNYFANRFYHHTVIILTDGEVSFPDQITRVVSEHSKWIKTCTLGIGNEASKTLLQNIASAGKCWSEFLPENGDLGERAFHLMLDAFDRFGFKLVDLFICKNHGGGIVREDGCESCVIPLDFIVSQWFFLDNRADIKSCRFIGEIFVEGREGFSKRKNGEISNFENAQITDTNFYHKIAYGEKLKSKEARIKSGYYSRGYYKDEKSVKQKVIDRSIKYQILSEFTQLVPVLQEMTATIQSNRDIQPFEL